MGVLHPYVKAVSALGSWSWALCSGTNSAVQGKSTESGEWYFSHLRPSTSSLPDLSVKSGLSVTVCGVHLQVLNAARGAPCLHQCPSA